MELHEHEERSQHRHERVMHAINEVKKGEHMSNAPMIFEGGSGGMGAAMGGGLGAGLLGGILGGALLGGNGGLFGRNNGNWNEGPVTPSQLTAALAGVQDTQMNTAVLQGLGDIKAAVPLAEANTQLAISQAQNAISNSLGQQSVALAQGLANVNDNGNRNTAAIVAVGEQTKDLIRDQSAALQVGIAAVQTQGLQNTYAITQAVRDDGEKTRALLIAQNEATLQRQLAVAEAALAETRAESRARASEINITNTNTATAQQLQTQTQLQNQFQILANLAAGVNNLANDIQAVRQTQSNVVFGNQTGSTQTASAANNRVS